MASMSMNFSGGKFPPPLLQSARLRRIAQGVLNSQKERWARSINVFDRIAWPLAAVTAKGKRTFGQPPKRNMKMTGLTVRNFGIRKYSNGQILLGNNSANAIMHAQKAQIFGQMIGFSPNDQIVLKVLADREFSQWLQTSWEPGA